MKTIFAFVLLFLGQILMAQTINWSYDIGFAIKPQSPAVANDGTIYIGSEDNTNFHAINPDGTLKWEYDQLPDNVYSTASIGVDGTIYVGSKDDYIHAINPDGTQKWVVQLPNSTNIIYSTPAIAIDGTIYVGSDDNNFYAINPDGTQKWSFSGGGNFRGTPAIASDGTVYITNDDDNLYAINPATGNKDWEFDVGGNAQSGLALQSDGTIIVGVDQGGTTGAVFAVNPDGTQKWSVTVTGRISVCAPSLAEDGTIYVGTKEDNNLLALDSADGSQIWEYVTGDIINSTPAVGDDGRIYFGSFDNHLYCLNSDGTLDFKVDLNDNIWSSPAITSNGDLIVGSYDGKLYSIDIPSSGLADSNWPMFGKNTRHTSSYNINWSYDIGVAIKPQSPAVADDGTIYIGSEDNTNFHAINPDGTLKWLYDQLPDNVYSSASIGVDGTIYVGSKDDYIHAINPIDGSQLWEIELPDFTNIIYSTPAIANDGTIYVGSDDNKFYAINPDGTQKWVFTGGGNFRSTPAIASDGTVYITNDDDNLYAINPATGNKDWEFDVGGNAQSGIALQADGTIIVSVDQGGTTGAVFAVNPDGTQKWSVTLTGRISVCAPALAEDGTIYVGTKEGNNLLALDSADGSQIWEYVTGDIINSSPAVGDDGRIYFGSFDNHLYCLNSDGTLDFKVDLNDNVWSSPAITSNGDLIVGSYDGKLYSIDIPSNGLADSNWPMFGKNTRHTSSDDTGNRFITYNHTDGYDPFDPSGLNIGFGILTVEDGTAIISSPTLLENVIVKPDAVLDLDADLTSDVYFESDNTGSAQLDDSSGVIITGSATVERYILANRAFRLLSSPVTTSGTIFENWQENGIYPSSANELGTHITGVQGTVGQADTTTGLDQTASGNPSMFTFDNTHLDPLNGSDQSGAWQDVTSTNQPSDILHAETPYLLFVRGDRSIDLSSNSSTPNNTTLRAIGNLFTSSSSIQNLSEQPEYFSLLANPFQATVDFNALTFTGLGNSNFMYVYDPSQKDFVTLETGFDDTNMFIKPGQSVFVVNNTGSATASTVEFEQVDINTSATTAITVFSDNQTANLKLELHSDTNGLRENFKIRFEDNALNTVDSFDAPKLTGDTENLASINSGNIYAIERRVSVQDTDSVPLYLNQYIGTNYEFKLNLENWNPDIDISIIDNYLNVQSIITPNLGYSFSIDSNIPESIASDRFSLLFDNTTLGSDENSFENYFSLYPNPTKDGQFFIKTPNLTGEVDIEVVNLLGQSIVSQKRTLEGQDISMNLESLVSGVYLIKLKQRDTSFVSKLIVE